MKTKSTMAPEEEFRWVLRQLTPRGRPIKLSGAGVQSAAAERGAGEDGLSHRESSGSARPPIPLAAAPRIRVPTEAVTYTVCTGCGKHIPWNEPREQRTVWVGSVPVRDKWLCEECAK